MNRDHVLHLLNGYIDGELDLVNSLDIEEHLKTCASCSQQYQQLLALHQLTAEADLLYAAPAGLEKRVRATVRKANPPPAALPAWLADAARWLLPAAGLLVLVVLAVVIFRGSLIPPNPNVVLAAEVQSAHIRSLMGNHLTDVTSSDQHTVKPWFNGKLDFSPPVVDLASQGFPLIGGRLDALDGHPVAALVYQRNKHLINLFIWPSGDNAPGVQSSTDNGYHLFHWIQGGMAYWAISDLESSQLQAFVKLVQENFK